MSYHILWLKMGQENVWVDMRAAYHRNNKIIGKKMCNYLFGEKITMKWW